MSCYKRQKLLDVWRLCILSNDFTGRCTQADSFDFQSLMLQLTDMNYEGLLIAESIFIPFFKSKDQHRNAHSLLDQCNQFQILYQHKNIQLNPISQLWISQLNKDPASLQINPKIHFFVILLSHHQIIDLNSYYPKSLFCFAQHFTANNQVNFAFCRV